MLDPDGSKRRSALENRTEIPLKCCDAKCLQNMDTDDVNHAINDSVYFNSNGMESWHSHIKVLYLCSLPRTNNSTSENWPLKPMKRCFIIPNCRSKMCVVSFRYILGLSKSSYYRIIKSCETEPSAKSQKHALSGV